MCPKKITRIPVFLATMLTIVISSLYACKPAPKQTPMASTASPIEGCDSLRAEVIKDYKSGTLKYYCFGIVGPSRNFVERLKLFHVTAISLGCTIDPNITCYDSIVDSVILSTYRVRISTIR